MKENIDYVVCQICGEKKKQLSQHVLQKHNIKNIEYLKKYPNSKLICEMMELSGNNTGLLGL